MPKVWTEEERKAFGQRMKALRESKQTVDQPGKKKPNVPRPPEMSEWRWQQHLKDSGFEAPHE